MNDNDSIQMELGSDFSKAPSGDRSIVILEKILQFAIENDISGDLITSDKNHGNRNVYYDNLQFLRLNCTKSNIGVHVKHSALKYFAGTDFENTTELVNGWVSISYPQLDESAYNSIFYTLIDAVKAKAQGTVGCCHLYRQCSDYKRCIIEEQLSNKGYAKQTKRDCRYRLNMLQGQIFYGVNALSDLDDDERELLKAYRYSDSRRKAIIAGVVTITNEDLLLHQLEELKSYVPVTYYYEPGQLEKLNKGIAQMKELLDIQKLIRVLEIF